MPSVFITGASTGIGRDVAMRMAVRGWSTYGGVRNGVDAEDLLTTSDGRVTPVQCDITDSEQITRAARQISASTGGTLTGLVNNAGIARPGPLEVLPIDDLREQLEVNVVGQLAVTQAFVGALRGEGGRVVNVGSVSGMIAAPGIGAYAMSKFALEALNDTLRRELAPWKIDVSLIQAGSVETPIWGKAVAGSQSLLDGLDDRERALYAPLMDRLAARAAAAKGTPVSEISDAIEHALTSRRPKTRYVIGSSARWISALRRILGDRGLDRLLRLR